VGLFLLIALGGIFGAYIPTAIALVTDTTNPLVSGTAFGIALFGAELGAVLGPVTGGFIAQHFGLQTAMYFLPASIFVAAILVWLAEDPRSKLRMSHSSGDIVENAT
jgi:MFS family permease